jgi:hypothetical protein
VEPVADGAGVTEEGDVVGTTVGCGVLVLDAGLAGVLRAVGFGLAAGGDVEGTLGEAVGCAGAGETVAAGRGLNST